MASPRFELLWLPLPSFSCDFSIRRPTSSWKIISRFNFSSDKTQSNMNVEGLHEMLSEGSSSSLTPWSSPLTSLSSRTPSPPTPPLPYNDLEHPVLKDDTKSHLTVTSTYAQDCLSGLALRDEGRYNPCVLKSTVDVVRGIEIKRDAFFASIKDIVLPLLGAKEQFYQTRHNWGVSVQPYQELESQPIGLRAKLKPYQLQGLSFLLHLRNNGVGGILGDEMGLGKTVQALALFQYIKEHENEVHLGKPGPFLVVSPCSVMETWLSEISKWTPELTSIKLHGTPCKKAEIKKILTAREGKIQKSLTPAVDIVVTSYETLISDIRWFRNFTWRYVVLDEGHRIKDNQSQRSKAIQGLRAEFKLILTGTPVQNNLKELWSIFHWLYPGVFIPPTAECFEEAFSLGGGKFDPKFLEHVQNFLSLIMLRRVKDSPEVGLSIPTKTETVLSVPLSDFQRSLYLRILTGIENFSLDGHGGIPCEHKSRTEAHQQFNMAREQSDRGFTDGPSRLLAKNFKTKKYRILSNILMELRKCSIHPYLLEDAVPEPYEIGVHIIANSGKYIVLFKMIEHFVIAHREKIVIFSNFTQALNLCEDLLLFFQNSGDAVRWVRLDGSTSSARRNLSTHLFQNDPSSSIVIFLDEDWNPQVMRQAEARVHRIGQTRPVRIFKLQSKGTVEEQISRRTAKKEHVAAKVMEDIHAAYDECTFLKAFDSQGLVNEMDTGDLSALIHSRPVLISDKLNAKDLSWLDWNMILNAWLTRAERVKTNIFDGKKVDTRFRSLSIYEALPEDLCRADRRIGKERTVMIDGFSVGKDSINLAALSDAKDSNLTQGDLKQMVHETTCFLCRKFNPLKCDLCPLAFHKECLESISVFRRDKLRFLCRWSFILLFDLL
ncbi:SNF2 family N-terminal domain-containing protein [Aspergillus alliaceus]|uniref:SNF2 family N-terminal domain-containing protein n=1 Tax=Petromyces alliaceus TaxID=209559 RepID=A0A5N7CCX6_PETAA|nr:SNF2 family N-terminal domain-containing protein [Aspergillus alliaceus]